MLPERDCVSEPDGRDEECREPAATAAAIPRGEYLSLLEKLPAAVYTCDVDGRITYFNSRAAETWGREPKLDDPAEKFCGAVRLWSTDGTRIEHDQCWVALTLRDNREYENLEVVIERTDGSRVTGLAHAHPLHDEHGKSVGAVGLFIDITDRKRAEEAQGRLVAIVESADDAIIGKDLNGIITNWNSGATNLFGYAAGEVIGRPVSILMPPDRVEEELDILRRIRSGESITHYETVRRHKDGTLLDISLSVSPIHDSRGNVIGASKIARFIGDRRRMEEALRDSDRRKDEFLAMLSHELRNPLATIRNSVHLLRMDPGDEMQRTVLEPLERQVTTLSRLVDDLMDVSRVTMGRVRLQRSDVALEGIVRGAVESVRREMADRRHAFTVSPVDPRLVVHVDEVRLEQVVVNLLTNAAKYTPDGGVITLSVVREGAEAVLCVRDSGIGIRPELLSQVFVLFSQGTTTLDRGQDGLGIGLALVKYLVEMHGGTVAARSAGTGKGSEFVVRLPVAESSSPPSCALQPAGTEDPQAREEALRVLVVDDNRDSADLQATLLRYDGHQVETAYDGSEALEAALRFRPNVILLDIGLPEIDGYEVAYRIRQHAVLKDVVLVAMTGYGQPEDRRRSQAVGFDHHLVKPAEFSELRAILASVAGRQASA
jgi:PAS domain S-box-containing protein